MISLWALTLVYWLHMLATAVWIGSLATLVIWVLPAAEKALDPKAAVAFLDGVQYRLNALAWFCLILLAATGMFQMSANPHYEGFLTISNRWAVSILLKHILFGGMIAISAYLTWGVLPKLHRSALRQSQGREAPDLSSLRKQNVRLLRLNLFFAILILAMTALVRVS